MSNKTFLYLIWMFSLVIASCVVFMVGLYVLAHSLVFYIGIGGTIAVALGIIIYAGGGILLLERTQ